MVSAPLMAGMLLHVGYHTTDAAFVGRLGPYALAGQTLIVPLLFVLFALINGLGSGITVLVAQAIGRRDGASAERVAGASIAVGMTFGTVFLAAGLLSGRWLIAWLGGTGDVATAAWDYFSVLSLGAPLFFTSGMLRYVLSGEGDTRTPMVMLALATVLNIALDPLFIFTFGLGIKGAAVATLVAQSVSLATFMWLLLVRRRNLIRLHTAHLIPKLATLSAVLRIGLPASLSQVLMAVAVAFLNRIIASFGEIGLAGFGVGSRIDGLAVMPTMGLAAGAVTVIGMFAGAGRVDLVRSTAAYVMRWGAIGATVIGTTTFATSSFVMRVFTDDAATIEIGQRYLTFMVFVYPMMGFGMVGSRLLLGLGHSGLFLLIHSIRLLIFGVPVAWILVFIFNLSLDGVCWSFVSGGVASTIATAWLVRAYIWQRDPSVQAVAA